MRGRLSLLLLVLAGQQAATPPPRLPLDPDTALASFVVEPGYRIDLVAAEPLVADPVAIAFDAAGRLYVVENRGYPDPLEGEPGQPPRGRVALLTDTDGDGRFDHRSEFASGLTYPNGVQPWDGGVFVTVAPDLLYLKDTDGDGVADLRQVALTGFNATRTAQIRFSHPTLGPDGWIYLTSGLNGGTVTSPARPDRPAVTFTGSDSRFQPRTGAFELVGGSGQYGLTFDAGGRRFICANRHPVWQVMLDPRQLSRNPQLSFSETVQEVSAVGAEATVWPLTADLTTASFHPTLMQTPHAGTFTSASGVHVHRGDALPRDAAGSVFIMESAQNLVQRQVLRPEGVSFRSRPARQDVEFLASRDSWFRPVFATNGPDGALYIVDMYRKDIDHPAYVPEESRGLFDFTAGRDRGRIYRLAATNRPPVGLAADLAGADDEALIAALGDANGWRRETAQRLLTEGRRVGAVPRLRGRLREGSDLQRLHALWTLDGLRGLDDQDLRFALRDSSATVREQALGLAERRLEQSLALLEAVLPLHADDDARVRFRAALALGATPDRRRLAPLAAIALQDGADRWVRAAVLSGVGADLHAFQQAFAEGASTSDAARGAVMEDVARIYGASESPDRCLALLIDITTSAGAALTWQPAAAAGLARGLRTRPDISLASLVATTSPLGALARGGLASLVARAMVVAAAADAPLPERLAAIELLGHAAATKVGPTLTGLLGPDQPPDVQAAAVRAIVEQRQPDAAAALVSADRWQAAGPRLRGSILTALLGDDQLIPVLLRAVEHGAVAADAVGAARWRRLATHQNATIAARARALVASTDAGAARRAFSGLRDTVLALDGRPGRGAAVFEQHCVACHTFTSAGGRIGPDLSGIRNQPAEALLLHIVVPDHEITPGYEAYTVETRDGRTLFGRLDSEAPHGVTIRDAAGQRHEILRRDIMTMTAAKGSLMPAGLEQAMPPGDLADLLAYLKRGDR